MKKYLYLLPLALVLTACPKSKDGAYTDAVQDNVIGQVDRVVIYQFSMDENGNLQELNESSSSYYENGIVTCDGDYTYYEEPKYEDDYDYDMDDEYVIPTVERDAEGRIVRKYHIIDDDTISIEYVYNRRGQVEQRVENDRHNSWVRTTEYIYDKNGHLVQKIFNDYDKGFLCQHDSSWYIIEEVDARGNWVSREAYRVSTYTMKEGKSITRNIYNEHERHIRCLLYSGDTLAYQPALTNLWDEDADARYEACYVSESAQTSVNLLYYVPKAREGYDMKRLNEMIAAWIVPESQGKTVEARADHSFGRRVEKLPAWDADAWLANPETYPARILLDKSLVGYYSTSRMAYFRCIDDGSSPSGAYVANGTRSFAYDLQSNCVVSLSELIDKKDHKKFALYTYNYWANYNGVDTEEDLTEEQVFYVLNWDWAQYEQRIEIYPNDGSEEYFFPLSEIYPYLNSKGLELLWNPSVFLESGYPEYY